MSDGMVDAALGATTGLLAVGVMTNVASKLIKPGKIKPMKTKLFKAQKKLW